MSKLNHVLEADKQASNLQLLKTSLDYNFFTEGGELQGIQLILDDKNVGVLDEIFEKNPGLRVIHLDLRKIPGAVFIQAENLPDLEFLLIKSDQIKKVSFSGRFSALTKIILNHGASLEEIDLEKAHLPRLEFIEAYQFEGVEGVLQILRLPESLPSLISLNIRNQSIQSVTLKAPKLKYLFAENNNVSKLNLKGNFNELSLLKLEKNPLDESLLALSNLVDEELQQAVKAYFKYSEEEDFEEIRKVKLILLGNTQAGKSTLRQIITDEKDKKEISTHGVVVFKLTEKLKEGELEIQGFDFGGQDYYHSTHLPELEPTARYFLVWGNGQEQGYGKQVVEGLNEQLYPIDYWLGGVCRKKERVDSGKSNKADHRPDEDPLTSSESKESVGKATVDIIQNINKDKSRFYLNVEKLKKLNDVNIGEVRSFDFRNNKKQLRESILGKLSEEVIPVRVKKADIKTGKRITEGNQVVYKLSELDSELTNKNDQVQLANRLDAHRYGFFPGKRDNATEILKSHYVARIDTFSKWQHAILWKEKTDNNPGYFTKQDAESRLNKLKEDEGRKEALGQLGFLLDYMLSQRIIFRVPSDKDKYMAPSYLPEAKGKVEELLYESFEDSECYFEFRGFFHSNMIHMIIEKFQPARDEEEKESELVTNDSKEEFLIRKNKVLVYKKGKGVHDLDQYVLISLELPDSDKTSESIDYPRLVLQRNKSKTVSDKHFIYVYKIIEKIVEAYKPQIFLKSPHEKVYIPAENIHSNHVDERGRVSPYFTHDGRIFNRYDFKLFLDPSKMPLKKVFIAYSKHDDALRQELRKHLKPLENKGQIQVFDDRNLEMGDQWDPRLKRELEQSDYFICLVSINSLNTPYVMELEVPMAIKLHDERRLQVIPLIISPCDWTSTVLGQFNAEDKGEAVINGAHNLGLVADAYARDAKWNEFVNKFKATLLQKKD